VAVIAVDTNILVYAHRGDSPWNAAARSRVAELAEGGQAWAIPWPCLHEFLAIVTHPGIYDPPTPLGAALEQVEAWMESPGLVLLSETNPYWPVLCETLRESAAQGPRVQDARVVALCREHGVSVLWSADRDFSRFGGVKTVNPLLKK
jgi:toxin-antitoxin system PIN domain toxin